MHHDLRHIKRSYTYMALMPVNFLSSQKDFHSLRQIHLKSKERDAAGLIKNPLSLRLMTPAFYYNFFRVDCHNNHLVSIRFKHLTQENNYKFF